MARRRGARKSEAEARIERLTWALLVFAFAVFQLADRREGNSLPNSFVPMSGAVILLGSAMFQYARRWRVSPVTWLAGGVMLFFALYSIYINATMNLLGVSLLVFMIVIVFGLVTNET